MDKESLEKAGEQIILLLDEMEGIKEKDRLELMINLYHFLDPKKYKKNVKILRRENNGNNK